QTNRSTHRQSPVNSSPSALRRRSAAVDERAYRRHTQNCQRGFFDTGEVSVLGIFPQISAIQAAVIMGFST
ncbi:hypothetical protein, partial [Oryzibacter oryziterrae]|uniref:hypothetical protein n=1 Tax=Oryzibacter oryziterrae TaxID=2766474 RepID=UPI001F158B3A